MSTVSMKQLKDDLGTYVAQARAGEHVITTDRDVEVAELVPLSPDRQAMTSLVAEGRAQWRGRKPRFPERGIDSKGPSASDLIIAER